MGEDVMEGSGKQCKLLWISKVTKMGITEVNFKKQLMTLSFSIQKRVSVVYLEGDQMLHGFHH